MHQDHDEATKIEILCMFSSLGSSPGHASQKELDVPQRKRVSREKVSDLKKRRWRSVEVMLTAGRLISFFSYKLARHAFKSTANNSFVPYATSDRDYSLMFQRLSGR
jgi:hypothetical protein